MTTATKEVRYTGLFEKTLDSKAKTIVHVGGAGSSKSYSIAQLLIYKLHAEENKQFLITRKTMPACKRSSYGLIVDLMQEYGIYDVRKHNKSDHIYTHGSNRMWFVGLDEPTKIKSIRGGVNYIWLEEANEFTRDDFITFKLQLRRPSQDERNHIYLSLNPTDEGGWIPKELVKEEDVEVIHSTFRDNPFLEPDAVKILENLANEDENYYRVYNLGEWGKLENLIYRNYKIIPELPEITEGQWAYGLDFGLINPSAVVKVYRLEDRFYVEERLYKPQLTNKDIIEFFSHEDKGDIYADPSAKQMIEEIYRANFNCYEAHKVVKDGIDLCQRQTLYVPESSINLIKEIRGYQWKKDKEGNILSEPAKFRDHLMDAMRYAIYGITERFGFPTAMPGGSEPQTSDPGFRF